MSKEDQTKKKKTKSKFNTELCDNKMTFEECELTILRHAVDETTDNQGKEAVENEDIKKMILILENFLIRKKCICYGGTAINNILPKDVQFYNKEIEIPDYDFFSKNALADAKELADIYFNEGFTDVEAKSGIHKGTYKVFVNFIPIADITSMVEEIYDNLAKESVTILGIKYCPPNYLRMSMYLELSRPAGDVSRWEKVFKRLNLLNKYYPLKSGLDCKKVKKAEKEMEPTVFSTIRDSLVQQNVVFFGGYAAHLYSSYMPEPVKRFTNKIPEFDVIVEKHDNCAQIVKERLEDAGFKAIELIEHDAISDIIPKHTEIRVNKRPYVFLYEPIACHNYNIVDIDKQKINIATIDTMLSFYLAFIYLDHEYYNKDRILCLAKYLYEVEQHNRLEQKSILKRFSTKCIGKQHGLAEIRAEKAEMFKKLSKRRDSKEYQEWFLKYIPSQTSKTEQSDKKKRVEKYVEEDEDAIQKKEENSKYGEEEYPKSIISKYKTKKSHTSLVFNEDFDNRNIYPKQNFKQKKKIKDKTKKYIEHSDIEHDTDVVGLSDLPKLKNNVNYRDEIKTANYRKTRKNKFWKRFYRNPVDNPRQEKNNKTKKKWFGLF